MTLLHTEIILLIIVYSDLATVKFCFCKRVKIFNWHFCKKFEKLFVIHHRYENTIISFKSVHSAIELQKKNRNHKSQRQIESEIAALPCNVHCFLPDLPDNGTMPAIAPKIGRITIKIFLLCVLVVPRESIIQYQKLLFQYTFKISWQSDC